MSDRIRYLSITAAIAGTFLHFMLALGEHEPDPSPSRIVTVVAAFLLSLALYWADRTLRKPLPPPTPRQRIHY